MGSTVSATARVEAFHLHPGYPFFLRESKRSSVARRRSEGPDLVSPCIALHTRREPGAELSMGDRHNAHRPKDLNTHDGAGSRNDPGSPVGLTRMRSRGTGAFSEVSGPRGAFWSAAVFCRSETLANDPATRLASLRPQPAKLRVHCAHELGMRKCLEINDRIPRFMGRRSLAKEDTIGAPWTGQGGFGPATWAGQGSALTV